MNKKKQKMMSVGFDLGCNPYNLVKYGRGSVSGCFSHLGGGDRRTVWSIILLLWWWLTALNGLGYPSRGSSFGDVQDPAGGTSKAMKQPVGVTG